MSKLLKKLHDETCGIVKTIFAGFNEKDQLIPVVVCEREDGKRKAIDLASHGFPEWFRANAPHSYRFLAADMKRDGCVRYSFVSEAWAALWREGSSIRASEREDRREVAQIYTTDGVDTLSSVFEIIRDANGTPSLGDEEKMVGGSKGPMLCLLSAEIEEVKM